MIFAIFLFLKNLQFEVAVATHFDHLFLRENHTNSTSKINYKINQNHYLIITKRWFAL